MSNIDLDSSHWVQSLFQRMDFKKRMQTSGKVEIPEGARKEAKLLYLQNIVTIVAKYKMPHSLIMNLDQTPLILLRIGGGGVKKVPPTNFSPVTSTNVGISPQNFLTFSFNPFVK